MKRQSREKWHGAAKSDLMLTPKSADFTLLLLSVQYNFPDQRLNYFDTNPYILDGFGRLLHSFVNLWNLLICGMSGVCRVREDWWHTDFPPAGVSRDPGGPPYHLHPLYQGERFATLVWIVLLHNVVFSFSWGVRGRVFLKWHFAKSITISWVEGPFGPVSSSNLHNYDILIAFDHRGNLRSLIGLWAPQIRET